MKKTFLAPAKINLCLHVLGKRPDGYHDLAMLMQRVSLFDRVEISLTRKTERPGPVPGVELPPGEENIAAPGGPADAGVGRGGAGRSG